MEINQLLFLLIDVVLLAIALILLIPVAVLFLECSAAFLSGVGPTAETKAPRPKVAVLIPAYNEAAGIAATISTILPQLTPQDRLLVIADNCTDATAEIARNCGASAIERQDTERKGKGYALDFGLQSIESDPPEVVIMVDADCICQPDAIEKLARVADCRTKTGASNLFNGTATKSYSKRFYFCLSISREKFSPAQRIKTVRIPIITNRNRHGFSLVDNSIGFSSQQQYC